MAAAGIDSRRNCEELILAGAVKVNRKIVDTLPVFADPDTDEITVDGRKLRYAQKVYYLLNKPKGVICTNYDPQGRKKAIDFIKTSERIFCVGRLDADTTGAIILTNDTELANKLTHPKFGIEKTYLVTIEGKITAQALEKLKKGIWLAERKTSPAKVRVIKSSYSQSSIQITISEGLNRQIRRMIIKTGYKVTSLKRIKIGKLVIRGIGTGSFRNLTKPEIAYLKK